MSHEMSVMLSVDRLDYTKGVVHRLQAFERLLERRPEYSGRILLVQVVEPRCRQVREYRLLKQEIDQLIGHINGRFSRADWSPIRYIYANVPRRQLVSMYRDSCVALVTPLRAGVNLVGKEYVACQIGEQGVLVVSQFAGASSTMKEALIVNPYETDRFSEAMHVALSMSAGERRCRMAKLRIRERGNDVHTWLAQFMADMATGGVGRRLKPVLFIRDYHSQLSHLSYRDRRRHQLALILHYGSVVVASSASLAANMRAILVRFSRMTNVGVCIVSSRTLDDLREMVGVQGITYAADNGLDVLHADGSRFTHRRLLANDDLVGTTTAPPGVVYILRTMYGVDWSQRCQVVYVADNDADDVGSLDDGLYGASCCTFRVSDTPPPPKTAAGSHRLRDSSAVYSLLNWIEKRVPKVATLATPRVGVDVSVTHSAISRYGLKHHDYQVKNEQKG